MSFNWSMRYQGLMHVAAFGCSILIDCLFLLFFWNWASLDQRLVNLFSLFCVAVL
jgi:hypothetical protein